MKTDQGSPETFGQWLQRQLQRREWSGADFARHMGERTSNGTVSLWLRDLRQPSPKSCDRIADVLAVDTDTVLIKAGHKQPTSDIDPNSYLAEVLGMAHRVDWETDSTRIELMRSILQNWIKHDAERREGERGEGE